jgi:hypothetical protein
VSRGRRFGIDDGPHRDVGRVVPAHRLHRRRRSRPSRAAVRTIPWVGSAAAAHQLVPPRSVLAPPRAAPNPGMSGRRETRSTGSTPPGAPAPGVPAGSRRSNGGGDRGSERARRDRPRTPRRGRRGRRRRGAARVPSSRG